MNTIVKIATGHYRIVEEVYSSSNLGGRPPGKWEPVPKSLQVAGIKYCSNCDRRIKKNNKSGICKTCSPHGKPLGK